MKKLVLSAAIAAVFAGPAHAAFTATAVPTNANGTPNWTAIKAAATNYTATYFTGSSAANAFLEEALRTQCNTAVSPVYKIASGTTAEVYVCSNSGTNANVQTPYLVMHKRDGGGSINAIKNAQGTLQNFVDETSAATVTACGTAANGISTCSGGTVTISTVGQAADVGLSDVDAAQFASPINGAVAGVAGLTSTAVATEIFGIAVNLNLRNAMQNAEVAAGILPATCNTGTSTLGSARETEACMPNLTSEQVSTIFANNGFTDWANIAYSATDGTTGYLHNLTAAEPGNSDIHICARTAGSGTWATLNIKFENAPCNNGLDQAIVTPSAQTIRAESGATGSQKLVHAMSGSGDVESCLHGLSNALTTGTFTLPTLVNAAGTTNSTRYAIAVQGVERNANLAKDYRFIKVDNVSPSAYNVVNGRHKLWSEMVYITNGAPNITNPLAKNLLTLMSDPLHIATLNTLNGATVNGVAGVQSWGQVTGFMGVATNANALPTSVTPSTTGGSATLLNAAFDPARPVNPYTHANASGLSLNHCRVPTIPNTTTANPVIMPAFYPVY